MLTKSKFLDLYNRQQESGLCVRDFCINEGISKSSFYYWRRKLQKPRDKNSFIPLSVKSFPSEPANRYVQGSGRDKTIGQTGDDILLELVYQNGTKLRIKNDIDLCRLRTLIHLCD